jgi:hypothetical protein
LRMSLNCFSRRTRFSMTASVIDQTMRGRVLSPRSGLFRCLTQEPPVIHCRTRLCTSPAESKARTHSEASP